MIRKAFSIRDSKSEIFHLPYFCATPGEAERNFRQVVNDPQGQINKFPEDYDLYYIGQYDDNTGKFAPLDTPEHIIKAINCIHQRPVEVQQ